jgi:hypothetical protein
MRLPLVMIEQYKVFCTRVLTKVAVLVNDVGRLRSHGNGLHHSGSVIRSRYGMVFCYK